MKVRKTAPLINFAFVMHQCIVLWHDIGQCFLTFVFLLTLLLYNKYPLTLAHITFYTPMLQRLVIIT